MSKTYDAIVIGAGAMGSAAAYYLGQRGLKTLLVEQFALDHQLGSSYGISRIIRYAYDHPHYIQMAHATYPLWRDLEAKSGETLMTITGGLDFGSADHPRLVATRQAMTTMQIPFETFSPNEVAQRFAIHLEDGMIGLYQPDAGFVRASLAVKTHVRLSGATLLENCAVQKIKPHAQGAEIETSQGDFSAQFLVVTGGSWAGRLLPELNLPLTPTREPLVFFQTASNPAFSPEKMPITICWGEDHFYTIPEVDGTGFKAARHCSDAHVNPDTVDRTVETDYLEIVGGHVAKHFPQLANQPVQSARVCLYTMTPDEHFILDRHPEFPQIAIGAGFSGHGFKFSTLIGKLLADLATQQKIDLALDLFQVARFV